jgi:hypothetical protein
MKNRLSILSLFLVFTTITLSSSVFAQAPGNGAYASPRIYIGIGTGINAAAGMLGIYIETPITQKVSFSGAAGIGSWGTKLTGTLLINTQPSGLKSTVGFGFSHASGLLDLETELEFEPQESKLTKIDLYAGQAINLVYNYSWKLGRKSKITLHTGYSINISPNNYKLKEDSEKELTSNSKNLLKALSPGGLILGCIFNFGL